MVCRSQNSIERASPLILDGLVDAIKNTIPQLIQRLDDSDSDVRQAVVNAMAELAKSGM
jgi:HEAT repeat protein